MLPSIHSLRGRIRRAVLVTGLVGVTVPLASVSSQTLPATPELPRILLNTNYAPPTGGILITVNAGGDLQAALTQAHPGDVIELQAGATFTGNFTLPYKAGTDWIYIRSSAYATLPAPGNRVSPRHAPLMPKIVSPNTSPAITTEAAAHHYRFIGVEITTAHANTTATLYNLIWLEYGGGQTSLSQVPTDIIFDRCYIHGTPTGNVRRGIAVNSARTAVIDSYLADFHEGGADSQAIAGWNGPGPLKIVNNYLEGAGENVMFGGDDPSILDLVPSDIEIRHNHFFKPLSWRVGDPSYAGIPWSVKNLFELKNAQRVLVDGNVFEQNWPHAQNGFSILFTVRNQNGTAPWSVVQDVTFTNNILRHASQGINILGLDNNFPSQQTQRILIKDNLFEDLGSAWGGSGRLFQLLDGTADIVIDHNTGLQTGPIIFAEGAPHTGFVYRNNLTPHNQYGVTGTGTGIGLNTFTIYFPGYAFVKNVLAGGNSSLYPASNYFPVSLYEVGFADLVGGNYRLLVSSPYKNAGTDGKDLGADIDALTAMTAGVVTGTPSASSDTSPPTVAITAPAAGAMVSGTILVSNSHSDNVGVVGVQYLLNGSNLGAEATTEPFALSWDTTQIPNGVYALAARARDAAGNSATSSAVSITIDNAAPVISAVAALGVTQSSATISWTTNEASDSQVEYGLTTAYGASTALNASLVTSHSQVLSGLAAGTLYSYRVKSRDAAGNLATSGGFTFTTLTPPPSGVTVTSSQASPVSGAVTLTATVSNTTGLTGVQFKLDGYPIETMDVLSPYQITWSAALIQNGSHTISAEAKYSDGTALTSAPLTLTVSNPATFNRTLYVDASLGNDANSGLSPGTAWLTLSKANANIQAGDTVYLKGTFTNQVIQPAVSGTAAKPIKFTSPAGQTAILSGGSTAVILRGRSYVVFDGLRIENTSYEAFHWTSGSNHNVVRNCFITNIGNSYGTWGHAMEIVQSSDNLIESNTITNVGNQSSNSGDSIWLYTASNRNRFLNNTIKDGGHSLFQLSSQQSTAFVTDNVIARNMLSNSYTTPIILAGGIGTGSERTLIEFNTISDAGVGSVAGVFGPRPGIQIQAVNNIIRYNEIFNNAGPGISLNAYIFNWSGGSLVQESIGNQIYHNVFYGNNRLDQPNYPLGTISISNKHGLKVRDNVIANNIFYGNRGGISGGTYYTITVDQYHNDCNVWPAGSFNGNRIENNIFMRQGGTPGELMTFFVRTPCGGGNQSYTLSGLQSTFFIVKNNLEVHPLFVNESTKDFHLQSGSPAIDRGRVIAEVPFHGPAPDLGVYETEASSPDTRSPSVPQGLSASAISSSQINLFWTASTDDGGVAGYRIFRGGQQIASLSAISYSDTGLSSSTLYAYQVSAFDTAGNVSGLSVSVSTTTLPAVQAPFSGAPFAVPGRFEAEDFDLGGEGLAYHDNVAGNAGGQYRTAESVDIVLPAGNNTGYVVNNFETGEWLEYTITVAAAGTYRLEAHVSTMQSTPAFHFEIDGLDRTGLITVPVTSSWRTFQWIGKGGVHLSPGQHILRMYSNQQYFDLDAIRLVAEDVSAPIVSGVAASGISSSGATITWTTDEASDSQVEYGLTPAYGSVAALDPSLVTAHAQTLSGLAAGRVYHYRVQSKDAAGNLAVSPGQTFRTFAAPGTRSPYTGVPFVVPGLIEAENFDNGGEGVAYHDMVPGNAGGLYRTNVDVDVIANGTGYAVNNIQTEEWLSYTINVARAGTYRIEAAVSSEFTTSRWHVEIDAVDVTGSILVPHTGRWGIFQYIGKSGVSLTAGAHILKISAEQEYFNLDALRLVAEDVTAPIISGLAASGISSSGATITWTTDEASDAQVEYGLMTAYGSATALNASLITSHEVTFNGLAANTLYHFRVRSRDAAGNLAMSGDFTFTTLAPADLSAPAVSITSPAAGATVSGTVTVSASASDNVRVVGVQFQLDGSPLGAEATVAPYAVAWDTTAASLETHTLTAVARDAAGNVSASAGVIVTVAPDTAPPLLSGVAASSITPSGATISWTTDEASDAQVEYGLTTAYGSATALNGSLVTAHVVRLSGLAEASLYHVRVHSRDRAGNLAMSADLTFTTRDGTPPAVSLTAPAAGATVAGPVTVTASATDNVGVIHVQFKLDGTNLGTRDTTAPYSVSWDTTSVPDGAHTLRAVARDAAGNTTIAVTVSVTVANGSLQVSLTPQDTFININATNYSADTVLRTYTWPDYRVANAILMKFDLAGLPAGAVVQEATLHLALVESDTAPESTYTVTAHKVVGKNPAVVGATGYTADGVTGWAVNACCYDNVPLAQADLSPAYATRTIDKTPGAKAWTITAMVQEWLVAPATNFGLVLNSDPSKLADRYRSFASMEHLDSALRPVLRITYLLPSTLDGTAPSGLPPSP